jgi:hypothetical protein
MTISFEHFSKKDTDELIMIANGTTKDWQQTAIDEAKTILQERNIPEPEQLQRFHKLKEAADESKGQQHELRRNEDYSLYEKIIIVIRWPREILWGWGLRSEGYELKAKRRLQLIGLGIVFTFFAILWASYQWDQAEKERIEKINNTDISDWEKKYYGVDSNGQVLSPKQ